MVNKNGPENSQGHILLNSYNNFRVYGVTMKINEILLTEKNKPTNPQLWGKAIAAAKRKYDVYPSAYANGFASKWYKERGGKWKTVKESQLDEISRPESQEKADEILRNAGYDRIGTGSFGAVYEKGDKVIKTFSTIDTAYLKFVRMAKQVNNPHFPKFYGNPIRITNDYLAVKQENLQKYRGDPTAIKYYIQYLIKDLTSLPDYYEEIEEIEYEYPQFKDACKHIADLIKSNSDVRLDLHAANIMVRGSTIVFVDPVSNDSYSEKDIQSLPKFHTWKQNIPKQTKEKPLTQNQKDEMDRILQQLDESLDKWFDEKWVDISRKDKSGKHPPCGASADKGHRKKSNKSAYPKCVPAAKAKQMTKKEKESASRRKREVEKKSSGKKPNNVQTKVKKD